MSAASPPPPRTSPRPDPAALPRWFRPAVVTVIVFVILALVGWRVFAALTSFWYVLFIAFFIALCMEPAVNRLAAKGMKRGAATAVVIGSILLSAVLFFATFGGLLGSQMAALIRQIPEIISNLLTTFNDRFDTNYKVADVLDQLGIGTQDLAQWAGNIGLGVIGFLGQALGLVFSMFMVLLFTFYFAADGPNLRRTVASWLPPDHQRTFLTVWDISVQKAGGYVISRGLMAIASAVFHGVVFMLLDVPYWLPMALWTGLVSQFIPTIGTYLAGALPTILTLTSGGWVRAVLVLGAVVIYQQIENYWVQPKITRSTLEIHPAVAFGSVIVGTSLFGATGALLAIPVVATVLSLISTYGRRYELVDELAVSAPEETEREQESADGPQETGPVTTRAASGI
ncbi:MAG: AI-2E family transporter [Candidatus Nanopelagicales bacterium]